MRVIRLQIVLTPNLAGGRESIALAAQRRPLRNRSALFVREREVAFVRFAHVRRVLTPAKYRKRKIDMSVEGLGEIQNLSRDEEQTETS